MFRKNKTNKAFTLIEVLIVTAVISLVASVVNAQMSEARQKADDAHMKTEVQQVRTAVEQYRQKTGTVPLAPSGGSYMAGDMVTEDSTEYQEVMQQLVDEGYMPEVPSSPDGQSYSYLATTDGEQAVFAAVLNNEDSSSGGGSGSNSGSNTNSCDFIETSIDFNSCEYSQESIDCSEVEYNESSEVCIDQFYAGGKCTYDDDLCEWFSNDTDLITDNFCQEYNSYDPCSGYSTGIATPRVCPYVEAVCSGTSNSDYCSCI